MLMAVNIYPMYLKWQERNPSRIIRGFSEKRFFKVHLKRMKQMSIEDLRKGAFSVMALIQTSFCGGQLKNRVFPRCQGFNSKSEHECVMSYRLNASAST